MDKKHTTIGAGMRRETSDPVLVERVAKVREQLGTDDEVRVEDLTPLQVLEMQEAEAGKRLVAAGEAIRAASAEWGAAWEALHLAQCASEIEREKAK